MPARSTDGPATLSAARAAALLAWYRDNARDLPWRRTSDPYRILISEIMLQQTRVETVVDRYTRFLDRFPTLAALAAADEEAVLTEWSGLGYYRRARNLHRMARQVVADHGGRLPRGHEALLALPGIGDYTAAAVGSIAYGNRRLSVDGNVKRVLARFTGWADSTESAAARRAFDDTVHEGLTTSDPGTLNQALMELGATNCSPVSPRCDTCPLLSGCVAARDELTAVIPPRKASRTEKVLEGAAVVERDGVFLMVRGQRPGALTPMWEFPTVDSRARDRIVADAEPTTVEVTGQSPGIPDAVAESLAVYLAGLGAPTRRLRHVGEICHGITTRSIRCQVYRAEGSRGDPAAAGDPDVAWFEIEQLDSIPLAASARKTLELLAADPA